jgi:FKBP-type peptidyl-prolyl cis-trans isomerase
VTTVKFSRGYSSIALVVCAASSVVAIAACSSDTKAPSASTSSGSAPALTQAMTPGPTEPATAASACPTVAPGDGGTPEWTLTGATGGVAVTGSTDTTAPRVNVTTPFSVTATEVRTLHGGDGPVVAPTATVSVCYMGVNGRDGRVFDSAYERGSPVDFPLDGVVPGFQKAIAGQKVGSTVGVAMTSADGYPDGQPQAGIQKGDTLVFAIKILSASS